MTGTNSYRPSVEDLAILHLPRTNEKGIYFPVCMVCGRDHHHQVTWAPTLDDLRVNETCDRCWAWALRFDG